MTELRPPTMQEQEDGFLGRWSRRKAQARQGVPPAEPAAPPLSPAAQAARSDPDAASLPAAESADTPALPGLADVQALTAESDFTAFMARGVAPGVRNAAMKKLFFADPHFNVMDGLDIYIDDYSIPSPLPLATLKSMASAKFLGLIDDEDVKPRDGGGEIFAATAPVPSETAEAAGLCSDDPAAAAPSVAAEPDESQNR